MDSPSHSDIQKAEKCIEEYLKSLKIPQFPTIDPALSKEETEKILNDFKNKQKQFPRFLEYESLEFIKKNLKTYRRQYVGYSLNGNKRIFCNFFPGIKNGEKDRFAVWRKEITGKGDIDGGGASYWTIEYCMKGDKCINLKINAPE